MEAGMKELLLKEFEKDAIYRMAVLNGLEQSLFPDGILSMHQEMTYSTVEAGRIIKRSDSTIRNHFRSDLVDYIQPEKFGKFYRMNYKSIFKLHLIFLLMEKAGKTSVDLLAELGMEAAVTIGGNFKRVPRNESREVNSTEVREHDHLADRVSLLEKSVKIQHIMFNILKYEKDIANIERQLENREAAIEQVKTDVYMRYLEEKQAQMFAVSLKKPVVKSSFFGLIKKAEEIDYNEIYSEIDKKLTEKMNLETKEKIEKIKLEIEDLKNKKNKLLQLLEGEKDNFSNVQLDTNDSQANLIDSVK
ncbi:hypothetical protein D1B31_17935 [Neobacillus notoginsengisoli]|uniref:Uncharacterized protein n=1 Tax=Neobacillus notoginsengisoli TaxID=1578198 RepID=A0A417YQ44_9BACI|nr:hypothetical protein [Neobacillus notoginsengisoli]RHW35970.1 hypothetical protein D1B31_17935 [Neobacillus notoginsengisoli]